MNDRLKSLLGYLEDDPKDPFNWYAVALEYQKSAPEKTREYFQKLLDEFPDYLPTYYHAAALLADTGERDAAEAVYQKGITLARTQQEHNALRELQNAYNELLFDD